MVQMFLMQTIPQSPEQEKFVLKRIISPICFRGMLTLKFKYSSVEINMVNYFTAKPYNGDNRYHKDFFYFPKNQIQITQYKNQSGKVHWLLYSILYCSYQNSPLLTLMNLPQSSCYHHQSGACCSGRPACCRIHNTKSVPDQEEKLRVRKKCFVQSFPMERHEKLKWKILIPSGL